MTDYGHWDISRVGEFDPADYFGFVYLIHDIVTQKKYIGRKQFASKRRVKRAGKKRRVVKISESDWKSYSGSSENLNKDISTLGKDRFIFTIVHLCQGKRDLGYFEVSEQFERDVLRSKLPNGDREYYNNNIMSRWFANDSNPKTCARISASLKGNCNALGAIRSSETRAKMGAAKRGIPKSTEHRAKISAIRREKGCTESQESKDKKSAAVKLMKWYNNGTENKRSIAPLNAPWVLGRLPTKRIYKRKNH